MWWPGRGIWLAPDVCLHCWRWVREGLILPHVDTESSPAPSKRGCVCPWPGRTPQPGSFGQIPQECEWSSLSVHNLWWDSALKGVSTSMCCTIIICSSSAQGAHCTFLLRIRTWVGVCHFSPECSDWTPSTADGLWVVESLHLLESGLWITNAIWSLSSGQSPDLACLDPGLGAESVDTQRKDSPGEQMIDDRCQEPSLSQDLKPEAYNLVVLRPPRCIWVMSQGPLWMVGGKSQQSNEQRNYPNYLPILQVKMSVGYLTKSSWS